MELSRQAKIWVAQQIASIKFCNLEIKHSREEIKLIQQRIKLEIAQIKAIKRAVFVIKIGWAKTPASSKK